MVPRVPSRMKTLFGVHAQVSFIIGANNERTVHNARTVLRRKKFIVLAAVKQSDKNLSCKQIQNQVAKKPERVLAGVTHYEDTLLYAEWFWLKLNSWRY